MGFNFSLPERKPEDMPGQEVAPGILPEKPTEEMMSPSDIRVEILRDATDENAPTIAATDIITGDYITYLVGCDGGPGIEVVNVKAQNIDLNRTLEGLTMGLTGAKVGSSIRILIPRALGYGPFYDSFLEEGKPLQGQVALILGQSDIYVDVDITSSRAATIEEALHCLSHILVKTEEEAKEAQRRYEAGEAFSDLAEKLSLDSSAASNGGNLGCNLLNQFVPAFANAARRLEMEGDSIIVQTQFGWYLIRLDKEL